MDVKIKQAMWDKAARLVAADAQAAYKQANTTKDGRKRKRHVPYSLPDRAMDLVKALGKDDAETVAAIMLYRYHDPDTFDADKARLA